MKSSGSVPPALHIFTMTSAQLTSEVTARSDVVAFLQGKGFDVETFVKYAATDLARARIPPPIGHEGEGTSRLTAEIWALAKEIGVMRRKTLTTEAAQYAKEIVSGTF